MKSKLLSIAVALLASFSLWVYVVTVVNQEVSNEPIDDIPVTFTGADQIREDYNLVITDGADATVDLRVTCSRQTLRRLSSSNISIVVDVSRIREPDTYTLSYNIAYPTGVANSDVAANGTPRTISITVERFTSKTVPVRGILSGSVAEGYYAAAMECSPNEVTLEGPESLINQASYVQVILDQADLTETVVQNCEFTLIDADGNPLESEYVTATANGVTVDTIEVRQPVLLMKEVPLTVEFVDGGGLTSADMIWSCTPNVITVAGEPEVLERTNSITVAQFDLSTLVDAVSEDMPVTLPNDLVNVAELESVRVNVSINANRVATETIRVTEFVPENVPDGLTADVMTVQLSVAIRGPVDQVEQITADDIRAVVDLSGLSEGTQSVPVTIEIAGGGDVAAIGEYSAAVSLTRE